MLTLQDRERRRTETRFLPCRLTDDELLDRGHRLAAMTQQISETEDRQQAEKKRMKAHLDGLYDAQAQVATVVSAREDLRDVACEVTHDYDAWQVRVVRTDTGELLSARAMTDDERQLGLPLPGGAPAQRQ